MITQTASECISGDAGQGRWVWKHAEWIDRAHSTAGRVGGYERPPTLARQTVADDRPPRRDGVGR